MAQTIRVLSYAVNGTGVGHLNRLIGINRWLRRYAAHAGARIESVFLTTSEADGLLLTEKIASFKMPSKTVVAESGISQTTYLAMAKQWVWHSIALFRPDVFIVDTWPHGSFGELLSALDLCKRRVFIYRPVNERVGNDPSFQHMLHYYDALIVPEHRDDVEVACPPELTEKLTYVGPIMTREPVELFSRTEARDRLGIYGDRTAIYVSAGGGGDPTSEEHLLNVCAALIDDPTRHLVVGAGPLYRGRVLSGDRITWLAHGGTSDLLNGIDLAVCAAGYNTFHELMHCGVPTVFIPQVKLADEQARRAARAVAAGAAIIVDDTLSGGAVEAAVAKLSPKAVRNHASRAARELVPTNAARRAAAEILRLVLPHEAVNAAEAAVDDGLLAAAYECRTSVYLFFETLRAFKMHHELSRHDAEEAPEVMAEVVSLIRATSDRGIPSKVVQKIAGVLRYKLQRATVIERIRALSAIIMPLASFGDWVGATSLVKTIDIPVAELANEQLSELAGTLTALRRQGRSVYDAIAVISEQQEQAAEARRRNG